MTAIAVQQNRSGGGSFLLVVLLLAFVMAAVVCGAHAVQRHGQDAVAVRECLDKHGQIELWFNPVTGRHARVCQIQDALFGVQITKGDREITSFVKDKMRCLDQVRTYLANRGYLLARAFR
jgi:hypothetical protein